MRHLLSLFDISQQELETIVSIGEQVKALLAQDKRPPWLARRVLALLFEKPSLRTRVSFEAGICHLGGNAMFLGQDVGWQSRETTADFVRVLAQYADFVVCRAKSHQSVEDLAKFNAVPIINGLTDMSHPCQALADLMTMREGRTSTQGLQVTFVGDGNNVARSLAIACAMTGIGFRLLGPKKYFMKQPAIDAIRERYPDVSLVQTETAEQALDGAHYVYTDVWTSMGQEEESENRRRDFAAFQLNEKLMQFAASDCKILHCLPAKRGEEITDGVMESPNSQVIEQAGNRMHAQKGLLIWLGLQHGHLTAEELLADGIRVA